MPEEKILICWPVGSLGYVVPGSLPGKCSQCGKPVWIAPSSWLLLHDNPELQIKCMPCIFGHIATHKGAIEVEGLTPAQREEVEEGLRGRRN